MISTLKETNQIIEQTKKGINLSLDIQNAFPSPQLYKTLAKTKNAIKINNFLKKHCSLQYYNLNQEITAQETNSFVKTVNVFRMKNGTFQERKN